MWRLPVNRIGARYCTVPRVHRAVYEYLTVRVRDWPLGRELNPGFAKGSDRNGAGPAAGDGGRERNDGPTVPGLVPHGTLAVQPTIAMFTVLYSTLRYQTNNKYVHTHDTTPSPHAP